MRLSQTRLSQTRMSQTRMSHTRMSQTCMSQTRYSSLSSPPGGGAIVMPAPDPVRVPGG
ncbi:hypothetical protein QF000_006870 [Paraburkholderia atlantica]